VPVHGTLAIRYALSPAVGTAFSSGYDLPFALSPDGRHIVYVGVKADATKQLWLHAPKLGLPRRRRSRSNLSGLGGRWTLNRGWERPARSGMAPASAAVHI